MATIILIRHGENEWVKKGRLAGWIEGVHLNEKGHEQAENAAQRVAHLPIKTVYSSPVTRCMETAEYIANALELPVTELPAMGEVRYGDWEGKKISKLAKLKEWGMVQHFPSRFQFPNGESFRDVQSRTVDALEMLSVKHPKEMIVVCSHADIIKLVLAHYSGMHMDLFQRIIISPASVSVLHLPPGGPMRVARINDTGLLPIPSPPQPKEKKKKKKDS
jgi:probable phosphoglycerate mutase